MHDLSNATFIIPIRLDSPDRVLNANINIKYLFKHFKTQVILMEADCQEHDELKFDFPGFTYIFHEDRSAIFHRTSYLNQMLKMVKTPIVVVHDIDVILPVDAYLTAYSKILSDNYDMWFPFSTPPGTLYLIDKSKFAQTLDWESLDLSKIRKGDAGSGFTIFFNTNTYRKCGAENEKFVSYAPEDKERYYRFATLGCKVTPFINRGDREYPINYFPSYNGGNYVCHLEHPRFTNSTTQNPHFKAGYLLYRKLTAMTKKELIEYYSITEPF
jgi:hypothetical protein